MWRLTGLLPVGAESGKGGPIMKKTGKALCLGLAALFLGGCTIGGVGSPAYPVTTEPQPLPEPATHDEAFAKQLFDAANQARIAAGLDPLQPSGCAEPYAQQRAEALVGRPLEHDSLIALNQACGLAGGVSGENLLRGIGNPGEFVQAWLDSPTHRMNLLNPQFVHGAMGCTSEPTADGEYRWLCSHLFLG